MLDDKYMFGWAHEVVYTWANNPDGSINRDKLVKVIQDDFISLQKQAYDEGRKDAALELQEGIKKLIEDFE